MKDIRKRVLFFAEAVTLAHLARCIVVANKLCESDKYVVGLACDSRFDVITGAGCFIRFPLISISCQQFEAQLKKGSPIYDNQTLITYVKDDLAIIEEFKPDFIIGDFRLSLSIASKLAKIPYATITNAYWSPYAITDYPIPEIPLTKIFGVTVAQKMFDLVRPLVFWLHSRPFNQACKKFGLPIFSYDLRAIYTHADYTLYADMEELFSMVELPNNHLFIGPVLWSAPVGLPDWWGNIPNDRPTVFVTLGSSGDASLLPMILETLATMPVTVICTTAQRVEFSKQLSNVFIADYLPADLAVMKADVVICNGGSPMVYQCLVENKAVIGIPNNLDQYLMMNTLMKAGQGIIIRSGQAKPSLIKVAVESALATKPIPFAEKPVFAIDKIMELIDSV